MSRRIVVLAYDGVQALDVIGPVEVFDVATRLDSAAAPRYQVDLVAARPGEVRTSSGLRLGVRAAADVDAVDTLVVAGGVGTYQAFEDPEILGAVRALAGRARRVTSVCSGSFLLAAVGLLDGRRATTHWLHCELLARMFPAVTVEPEPIFVRDGQLWTSAGVTAGMDLALALVADDHGPALAAAVARHLVLFVQRPGGQAQFSAALAVPAAEREPIRRLQQWLPDHLADDLSVPALARRARMPERSFARAFRRETGTTPASYVERLRVEVAKRELECTRDTVAAVARRCGFGTAETLHRAFRRHVGTTPHLYRQHFQAA